METLIRNVHERLIAAHGNRHWKCQKIMRKASFTQFVKLRTYAYCRPHAR